MGIDATPSASVLNFGRSFSAKAVLPSPLSTSASDRGLPRNSTLILSASPGFALVGSDSGTSSRSCPSGSCHGASAPVTALANLTDQKLSAASGTKRRVAFRKTPPVVLIQKPLSQLAA